MKILRLKTIYGCEASGDANSAYLIRLTIFECRFGAIYLHRFLRSDADEHHDHPWSFVSIILWRGYFEETPCRDRDLVYMWGEQPHQRKRVWPGMILFRPATWRHRVMLVNEKPAWSLVIRGRYVRDWGFFTKQGRVSWKDYFRDRGC